MTNSITVPIKEVDIFPGEVVINKEIRIPNPPLEQGQVSEESPEPNYSLVLDPYTYYNGNNGLTVEESAERVIDKCTDDVFDKLDEYDEFYDYDATLDYEVLCPIIAEGRGRHYCYKLLGGIKKGLDEGKYKGVPVYKLLEMAHRGELLESSEDS